MEYKKLSRTDEKDTKIMAGQAQLPIKQLEDEMIDDKSEIGKKLRSVEKILENY